ncbi:endonuclease/exonuclease/phosphatase family protein [Streptomyces triculaminicus]|uniref:Endonuclease/exonuclease/phosphatase family protein n=2 Tax=Streptomyces TaxID=1883 RepID=A0A939JTG2_9ACTN|nr:MULTISPECIES: endonuclease/exonuclease/phosphatase family protein [Streptomyces]MBO0655664.1 endonuclease/exonuclease/phosphatase family protein [Streptomyces triculaminicus]QSY50519.1 endonuclease/exonuclease/phosphatase family protein [Streptomyces griseocarneus]
MTLRIATFNAENLFRRPVVFGIQDAGKRDEVLDAFRRLVEILEQDAYSEHDKEDIITILLAHSVDVSQEISTQTILVNEPKGMARLLKGEGRNIQVRAEVTGRTTWVGWAELVRGDLTLDALRNTAKVIAEVNADILLTVEVEDRLTLHRFNQQVLHGQLGAPAYPFNLLIDGNDIRGIDVGLLSRHPITSVRSHIFDTKNGREIFSRDCPEFEIDVGGKPLWLLGNHFKSKRGGGGADKRKLQGERVAQIYRDALGRSDRVVVAGDLNDTPDSEALGFLLGAGLQDAMTHGSYQGPPGTHGKCTADEKIDYVMFSPELFGKVTKVRVETRGIAESAVTFDTVHGPQDQASDHASLFADLEL